MYEMNWSFVGYFGKFYGKPSNGRAQNCLGRWSLRQS
jgi:hypothetical protein